MEFVLFIILYIERLALRSNQLASFRRLCAVSALSNAGWLLFSTLGLFFWYFRSSTGAFFSFLVLGLLLAVAFRIFVVRSVFSDSFSSSVPLAIVQPALLGFVVVPNDGLISGFSSSPAAWLGGSGSILSVILYVASIERSGAGSLGAPPLRLLKHFLLAWAQGEASELEADLEKFGLNTTVRTYLLRFETTNGRCEVIVPDVHPGPFYPVGSSNLPADLQHYFSQSGTTALVMHGLSGHARNLPSKRQVQAYIESLASAGVIERVKGYSGPVTITVGKATVTGMGFGSVALVTVTLSPNGMEDFPGEVSEAITKSGNQLGWKGTIVVDSHNCQGSTPSPEESQQVVEATHLVLEKLKSTEPLPFAAGFAHSSELGLKFGGDVASGGAGALVLSGAQGKFALLTFDANNAVTHLREKLLGSLTRDGIAVLEVCTSDTHFTAARTLGGKGYIALGELTEFQEIGDKAGLLITKAVERLNDAEVEIRLGVSTVSTMSQSLIETFSHTLDRTLSVAKRGAIPVLLISGISLIVNVLLAI